MSDLITQWYKEKQANDHAALQQFAASVGLENELILAAYLMTLEKRIKELEDGN